MRGKLLLAFLFSGVILSANVIVPTDSLGLSKEYTLAKSTKKVKDIKNYNDYLKFKKDMQKVTALKPSRGYFFLGVLYLNNFNFKDKKIKANPELALDYFYKSYKNGNKLAAYFFALLEYQKGNIFKVLNILDNALSSFKDIENPVYALLAKEYGTFVLEQLKDDKEALKKAISFLGKVDAKDKVAAYLLANLYYFYGPDYLNIANKLLNYACHTNNKGLEKVCAENPYIKGNKVKISCPILKRQEQ